MKDLNLVILTHKAGHSKLHPLRHMELRMRGPHSPWRVSGPHPNFVFRGLCRDFIERCVNECLRNERKAKLNNDAFEDHTKSRIIDKEIPPPLSLSFKSLSPDTRTYSPWSNDVVSSNMGSPLFWSTYSSPTISKYFPGKGLSIVPLFFVQTIAKDSTTFSSGLSRNVPPVTPET